MQHATQILPFAIEPDLCQIIRQVEGLSDLFRRLALDHSCKSFGGELHKLLQLQAVSCGCQLAEAIGIKLDELFIKQLAFLHTIFNLSPMVEYSGGADLEECC